MRRLHNQVAYATYTETTGAVIVADMFTGSLRYFFTQSDHLQFGNSRSSVAVDKEGCTCLRHCLHLNDPQIALHFLPSPSSLVTVREACTFLSCECAVPTDLFVGSLSPGGDEPVPVFWCLDITRDLPRWAVFVGHGGDEIDASSPFITTTVTGAPVIMFASEYTVRGVLCAVGSAPPGVMRDRGRDWGRRGTWRRAIPVRRRRGRPSAVATAHATAQVVTVTATAALPAPTAPP